MIRARRLRLASTVFVVWFVVLFGVWVVIWVRVWMRVGRLMLRRLRRTMSVVVTMIDVVREGQRVEPQQPQERQEPSSMAPRV